jgi:hypothetical protein
MTYDLYMFRVEKGQSVIEAADELLRKLREDEKEVKEIITSEERAFMDHLALVLTSTNKALQANPSNFMGYSIQVYCNSDPNEDTGIIDIYKDRIEITVAYGRDSYKASRVMLNILTNLKILQKETGFVVYDPQSRIEVNIENNIADLLDEYAHGTAITDEIAKKMKKGLL